MSVHFVLVMVASVAFNAPAIAATMVGSLTVSATVAFPCTVVASDRPAGPICAPAANPSIEAAPHAIRSLRRDPTTGITTMTIDF